MNPTAKGEITKKNVNHQTIWSKSVDMVNQDVTHIVSEEDKLILDGNQLIIERRIIERSNDVVSVKYIKNLE